RDEVLVHEGHRVLARDHREHRLLRGAGDDMRNWTANFAALAATAAASFSQAPGDPQKPSAGPTLEETRLKMEKWIETQQLISKERNEWQQGKEILLGRLELVKKEVASLQEKLEQAQAGVAESQKKRDELTAESDRLKAV